MKTLNFFRKPYLAYVMGFMLLFVSCKQYDAIGEPENNSLYKYSKQDIDNLSTKLVELKASIDRKIYKGEIVNPFAITERWYLTNYNSNIPQIDKEYKNDLLSFVNLNNYKDNTDIFAFIENNNIYSQAELTLLNSLKDDILNGNDFNNSVSSFNNLVINSSQITENRKQVLLNAGFVLSSLHQSFPNAFIIDQNKNVSCVVSAIGLGFAIIGLIAASGGTAAAAAVAGGGYVTSLIGTGLSCFSE